jgi:hypothetical protein
MDSQVVNRTQEELNRFLSNLPLDSTDQVSVVLKGHLLVEELLREYVNSELSKPEKLKDARLSFHHILAIARALSKDDSSDKLWDSIEKLNNLRNKLAHSLDKKIIEKRINGFVEHISNFNPQNDFVSPNLDFGVLASCILGLCMTLSIKLRPSK